MMKKTSVFILLLICTTALFAQKGVLKGKITDKETNEPLAGASVRIAGSTMGTVANEDGEYELSLSEGSYDISFSYISFAPLGFQKVRIQKGKTTQLNAALETLELEGVTIAGLALKNTDASVISSVKSSGSVANGISAQQISKTQDRNAAEVIRRIPGVVVTESRFVNVRGLSQRYNNVYLNNAPTPSSETDIRAFAFDVLPGSQIENMLIMKSPMANTPADFSGGFIKILTKNRLENNEFSFSYAPGYNLGNISRRQHTYKGSSTDWLGFDNGTRKLPSNFPLKYNDYAPAKRSDYTQMLNQNWELSEKTPLPEHRFSTVLSTRIHAKRVSVGNFTALNYSNSHQMYDMFNARYGIYSAKEDHSVFSKQYNDTVYNTESRLSALHNWVLLFRNGDKMEWCNFFNQSGRKRTTLRSGMDYGNEYEVMERELYYSSRTTYSGQLNGEHHFRKNTQQLTWGVCYSFASKQEPDRKIIVSRKNNSIGNPYYGQYYTDGNDIKRNFQNLREHIVFLNTNYEVNPNFERFKPTISSGLSLEYRSRDFAARNFTYTYGNNKKDPDYPYLPYYEIVSEQYLYSGGTSLSEKTNKSDSYDILQFLPSAYISVKIPFAKKWETYIGLRYENNIFTLNGYESDGMRPVKIHELQDDFYPSANLIYNINRQHLLRACYGRSINRPEFRELAPYVYYDFDLFANFEGNPNLKNAYIQNFDLRYEYYPSSTETISLGLFYKFFKNPIEITYFYTGGQLQYSFDNAKSARNAGIEVEVKVNLQFMGLKDFSLVANAAFINSKIHFDEDEPAQDRAMQGQSPFLVNAALFFQKEEWGLNACLQYNITGKRIVVLGESNQDPAQYIPDTYEMPRNMLDFSISKTIGKHVELSLGMKDILNQKVVFKQFPTIQENGTTSKREQITRSFSPGQVISLGVSVRINN
ncbi:MAG: TonB-dependent receptor [Bacteroidales bacterium]|nr:TonB-dependent receptor [Bacteroidales bacterium]